MTREARSHPIRLLPGLASLAAALVAAVPTSAEPAFGLALTEDGRIRLTLARPVSSPQLLVGDLGADRAGLSFGRADPRPALCALSLGSVLCAGMGGDASGEGGVALAWNGEGWHLTLDYRPLLDPVTPGRAAAEALALRPAGERLALSGDFGSWGLALAVDRWQPSSSALDLARAPARIEGLEDTLIGLSLDFRHANIAGRLAARRYQDHASGSPRVDDAIDVGLLLRTPWRAEFEMGALNVWHENRGGERSQPVAPPIGRTPYVRYRQDF